MLGEMNRLGFVGASFVAVLNDVLPCCSEEALSLSVSLLSRRSRSQDLYVASYRGCQCCYHDHCHPLLLLLLLLWFWL